MILFRDVNTKPQAPPDNASGIMAARCTPLDTPTLTMVICSNSESFKLNVKSRSLLNLKVALKKRQPAQRDEPGWKDATNAKL